MKHMHSLLLLAIITIINADPQITVFPSQNKINQITTYLFTFNIGSISILPGNATIVFPSSAYAFNSSSGITGCFDSTNSANLYGCIIGNSSAFSFRWTAAMGDQIYMSINSIQNPSYVDNYQIAFTFSSDGGTVFTPVYGSINNLMPDELTSCSMAFAPTFTNSYSAVTFSIVNKSPIPAGGSMQLTFVGYTPSLNTSSVSISVTDGGVYINSSAISSVIGPYILLPNFFTTAVPSSTTLVFRLSFLLSPPTTASSFSITVLTYAYTNFQYKIDEKSCPITAIADLPTLSLSVYTSTSSLRVGAVKTNLFMDFKAPASLNFLTDRITVQVSSSSSQYLLVYSLSGVTISNNVTSIALPATNTTTGVSFPTAPTSSTISSGTGIKMWGFFLNALVSSGSKSIAVQFLSNNVSYSSGTATIMVYANILLSVSVTPAITLVLTSTTYSFVLQTNNPLGIAAAVVITLPTNVTIASGVCNVSAALSLPSSLSSSIACSASGQVISITSISNSVLPANTTITLNISGITNPAITKATNSFFFETYYGPSQMANPVDDSSGYTVTMTPSAVTIPNSYFSVSRADTANMKYTTYTFIYRVFKSFPANGIITIVLPTSMVLSATATATYTLSQNAANQTVPMSSSTNSTSNRIVLNFTTATLPANTTFTIVVSSILNHYSYKPISVLLVSATSDGFAVEQSNAAAFSLSNTIPDATLSASDRNSNTINGASVTYSFSIITPSLLYTTDMVSIQLLQTNNSNTQLLYSATTACRVNSVTVACSRDSSNSRLLYVVVGSNITANSNLTVSVSNITLSRSMDPPGSITVNTLQVSGSSNYLISTRTFSPSTNLEPNLINNARLTINDNGISSQRLNVPTSFTLSFQPTNLLISGDYIVVSIPVSDWTFVATPVIVSNASNVSSMTSSLCSNTNIVCSNYNNDTNKIRVDDKTGTAFPTNTNISFTFPSTVYVSTKQWATNYSLLIFNTYTRTNNSIDSSANSTSNTASFALACPNTASFRCKTCNTAGSCLSCYQTGDGVDATWTFQGYFFRQSTGECVTACGAQYYNSSNFCQLCSVPCFSCTNGSTNACTSCIAPTVRVDSTCLSSCSAGYFNSSGVCMQCTSPCSTCVNTSTTCQTCSNGSYLNGTSCVGNCNGMTGYFADNVTWTCNQCSNNCTNCSLTSSNCTSCAPDYFFVSGTTGTCSKSCPPGTVKVNSTLCSCDYTKCKTCAITIDTCTSCDIGLVLLNTACSTSCGQGYYLNNTVCAACPSNCVNCTSSTCFACSNSAIHLYNNTCYAVCPVATTASSTSCITCPQGCSVCTSSTECMSCFSIYYLQINSDLSTSCVGKCAGSTPLAQGVRCVSECTPPLIEDSGFCIANSSNNNNNNATSNSSTSITSSKILPMPVTIGLFILASLTLVSKIVFQATIVWASLSAFAGMSEVLVWFIFMIAVSADPNAGSLSKTGLVIVLLAYIINLVLNIVSLVFFRRYIWSDDKFQTRKLRLKKTKCGLCLTYLFVGISVVFSHKWIDILFSNLFQITHCIYKISGINRLTPINYVRYVSVVASIIAVVGAAIAGYDTQAASIYSMAFMESIDLILVTIVSCIFSIVATKRNAQQYQKTTGLKSNDIQQKFDHDPVEQDINHFQKEEKGGSFRKKYTYSSSIRNTDPKQNPLSKRNAYKNPIGEEFNLTNVPLENHDDDNNRISLNDMTDMSSGGYRKRKTNQGLNVQEINFAQESGENLLALKSKMYKGKISNRQGRETDRAKRQKEQQQSKEKQKFKDNIQSRLNEEQRLKAKIIGDVDQINTSLLSEKHGANSDVYLNELSKKDRKKEKLQVIAESTEENLNNLPEKERGKAGQIKNAISLIKGKKISIDDYLHYMDIIQQQDQDKNSDEYQNKNLASKFKGRNATNQSTNKKSKNLVKSLRKNDRRERSARYQKDPKIFVDYQNDGFDEQKEPEQPDFHQSSIRARNQSQQFEPSELQELRLSNIRTSNNRSDQLLKKDKSNIKEKLLDLLQSGENDEPSLAQQFKRGNTLKNVEKDQLPPSNLYSTEKMQQKNDPLKISFPTPTNANKMGPNRLLGNSNIQYIESEGIEIETVNDQLIDYEKQITPSPFDQPNQRIQNQKSSNAPSKPKLKEENNNQVMQIQDLVDAYDEFENPDQQGQPSRLQRYQSDRTLDYDQILLQKRRNEKQKELEKIYLPRLDVTKMSKKKKKIPKAINSERDNQK